VAAQGGHPARRFCAPGRRCRSWWGAPAHEGAGAADEQRSSLIFAPRLHRRRAGGPTRSWGCYATPKADPAARTRRRRPNAACTCLGATGTRGCRPCSRSPGSGLCRDRRPEGRPICVPQRRHRAGPASPAKESFDSFKAAGRQGDRRRRACSAMALDRMLVANECDKGPSPATAKESWLDPSWTTAPRRRRFAIGFFGRRQRPVCPLLLAAMKPIAAMNAERFPVTPGNPVLACRALGTKDCKECVDKARQSRSSATEKAVRIPGRRPADTLLGEDARDAGDHPEPRHQRRGSAARHGRHPEDAVEPPAAQGWQGERPSLGEGRQVGQDEGQEAESRPAAALLCPVLGDDRRVDPAAHFETRPRRAGRAAVCSRPGDQVRSRIRLGDRLVERSLVNGTTTDRACQDLELDAQARRDVLDPGMGGEVRLARSWGPQAGKFWNIRNLIT